MTIEQVHRQYLDHCRVVRLCSPSSMAKYQDLLRSWILPRLGEVELPALTLEHVFRLRREMVDRRLSVARQYGVVMCLKSLLKFCRSVAGIQTLDPASIQLPRKPTPVVAYLDNADVQRVLDGVDLRSVTGLRLRALIELLLGTGLRISEALSLGRAPFDRGQSEETVVGKGQKARTVFFTARCRFWAQRYLDRRVDDDPALFVTTGFPVRRLARADISRFFVLLKKKVGLEKKLTPHVLRHTYCTNLLHHGADITHIKDLAGHEDIQTTARYYLGKDPAVLRGIVDRCLDYRVPEQPDEQGRDLPPADLSGVSKLYDAGII